MCRRRNQAHSSRFLADNSGIMYRMRGLDSVGVDVVAIPRETTDFQQPVDPSIITAILRRALVEYARILRVVEIGVGTYNNTYRVDRDGEDPVYLRIAPERSRQGHRGRDAMRNEHAATPFLSVLGPLIPRTLAADFTHQLLDRDYLVQTAVPVATAGPRYSIAMLQGKFHGVSRAHTPRA